jgi:Flp pilus assembly pilin Flp
MRKLRRALWRLAIWREECGQDLVEYALLAGLIAVTSGIVAPAMADDMSTIYSRLSSKLVVAGG